MLCVPKVANRLEKHCNPRSHKEWRKNKIRHRERKKLGEIQALIPNVNRIGLMERNEDAF